MASRNQSGFTLYELLITIVIIGIVLSVGIPNFGVFTQNSRITSTANDLHSSFHLGRSEAARSKSNITICASANSMDAAATCGGTFNDGWIIFIDLDGNIQRDVAGDENVLRRHPVIDDAIDIVAKGTGDVDATYFSFAPTGLGRGDQSGFTSIQTAVICDGRGNVVAAGGNSAARYLVVTPIGRATVLRDVTQIAAAGGCP